MDQENGERVPGEREANLNQEREARLSTSQRNQSRRLLRNTGFSRSKKIQTIGQTINLVVIITTLALAMPISRLQGNLRRWVLLLLIDRVLSMLILFYAVFLSWLNIDDYKKKTETLRREGNLPPEVLERRTSYLEMKKKSDEIWLLDSQQESLYWPIMLSDLFHWISFFQGAYVAFSSGTADYQTTHHDLWVFSMVITIYTMVLACLPCVFALLFICTLPFIVTIVQLINKRRKLSCYNKIQDKLVVQPYQEVPPHSERTRECSICAEDFQPTEKVIVLPCSDLHIFHESCLKDWLMIKQECPFCRANLLEILGEN